MKWYDNIFKTMKIKRFTSGRDFPALKLYIFTLFGQDTCILKRDLIKI